jgi:hypothetical protein
MEKKILKIEVIDNPAGMNALKVFYEDEKRSTIPIDGGMKETIEYIERSEPQLKVIKIKKVKQFSKD